MNNFQGRYAIRHPWIGPIDCKEPKRGVWGGPWQDLRLSEANKPSSAEKTAFVPRGGVTLTSFVRTDVPELGVQAGKGPLPLAAVAPATASIGDPPPSGSSAPAPSASAGAKAGGGCGGCSTTSSRPGEALAFGALLVMLRRRRRR